MKTDYDVLIAGAGMVGATLACALGDTPLRVGLIDRAQPVRVVGAEYDLRVSAFTRASERIFRALGAWDGMVARRVSPFREMQVWDAGGDGAIHFDCAEVGEPHLGHIIENNVVVAALLERLERFTNVALLCPAEIAGLSDGDAAIGATLKSGETLKTGLLVGADGARSLVREFAGIESRGWSYRQQAIVATVTTALPHRATAWQRFLPTGPLAFLPLADGSCSIVWSNDSPQAELLMQLDADAFRSQLQSAFEARLGEVTAVGPRAAFTLRLSHADRYVDHRVALVGDAAHTVHPLAGQGANLGLADAAALAEVLLDAVQARKDIGARSVLRRYERWRKGDNLAMLGAMDGFKRLFGNNLAPARTLRNLALTLTDAATPVKNLIIRRAMGLEGDLPKLARGIGP